MWRGGRGQLNEFLPRGPVQLSVDTIFLEFVQAGLCGCHGLNLDDFVRPARGSGQSVPVCLGGVACPVRGRGGEVTLELFRAARAGFART